MAIRGALLLLAITVLGCVHAQSMVCRDKCSSKVKVKASGGTCTYQFDHPTYNVPRNAGPVTLSWMLAEQYADFRWVGDGISPTVDSQNDTDFDLRPEPFQGDYERTWLAWNLRADRKTIRLLVYIEQISTRRLCSPDPANLVPEVVLEGKDPRRSGRAP
jgi:hypothetical protein